MIPDYIEPIKEKKQTLGQQWLDVQQKYSGQMTQNIGDTTRAMKKSYVESFEKIWNMHSHLTKDYYIWEVMKPDNKLEGVYHCHHYARWSRPFPDWDTQLFKVSNKNGECTLVWGLPSKEQGMIAMQNPEGWDPWMISDITKFLAGTLDQEYIEKDEAFLKSAV